ncbi:MAG: fumarylacetoacetase [Candidatus Sumerlaeia bacterium]|nr:fumarylacetoacetase [Candidatus Sumerlaeia bacterium]
MNVSKSSPKVDPTTDPKLRAFFHVAEDSPFSVQNLPYGVFRKKEDTLRTARIGVAIGDKVLDLAALDAFGQFTGPNLKGKKVFSAQSLNAFIAMGRPAWREARLTISALLTSPDSELRNDTFLQQRALIDMTACEMMLPVEVGDYTDFYASRHHATNVGTMLRGAENALNPNWLHLPVGYHGRSSSVVLSGADIVRPCGQIVPPGSETPIFAPSRSLDYELEVGIVVGPGNALGEPVPVERAVGQVFGMVLLNDWSARDIQKWEYQPLGPFLGKNFATTISPWVVPIDALIPFCCAGPEQDPEPLPYLQTRGKASFDIHLEAHLYPHDGSDALLACATNYNHLYWNVAQMIAHHTSNGCNLRAGDLLGTGTVSGPEKESRGCLLERTWKGEEPLELSSGAKRTYLEDGDLLTLTGWCQGEGYRVGFGECAGRILPARISH